MKKRVRTPEQLARRSLTTKLRRQRRSPEQIEADRTRERERSRGLWARLTPAQRRIKQASTTAWRAAHPEQKQQTTEQYCSQPRVKEAHLGAARRWNQKNPAKCAARCGLRRARRLNATPLWLTEEHRALMRSYYELAQEAGMHVDHKIPLAGRNVCGLHVPWNLQVLPPHENQSKGNRT